MRLIFLQALTFSFWTVLSLPAQSPEQLDFLKGLTESRHLSESLPGLLRAQADAHMAIRHAEVAAISTEAQLAARRAAIRQQFLQALGGLPERTPLNARVTGALDRPAFRIEKILFESQPGFWVTANLYLPKSGPGPFPAVLYPLGHEPYGKAYPAWQTMLGALATKGYVALTWDPLGQGERIQHWDPARRGSVFDGSTTEHTILGIQTLLTGENIARYTIWDGIRALDYLLSRPEVDPARIAVTGNSGGGTHSSYLAALDDRIAVAAPSCYITSWPKLLDSIGPQDAEQNLPPWIGMNLDHGDFLLAFAPKPFLILSAIRDFFSISGARATFREVQAVYDRLGAGNRISQFAADDGHGYTQPRRLAAYDWFSRWFKNQPDTDPEPEVPLSREEELWVTGTGQVSTEIPDGATVFTMNRDRAVGLRAERERHLGGSPAERAERVKQDVAELLRLPPSPAAPPASDWYGTLAQPEFRIEKLVYESEPGLRLPALLYVPAQASPERKVQAMVWIDPRGKSQQARAGSREPEALARRGYAVLVPDLRGWGETRPSNFPKGAFGYWFGDWDDAMASLLLDRPLVGQRVLDIGRALDLLAARPDIDSSSFSIVGRELASIPVLAAAVTDARISRLALVGGVVSWESVVLNPVHRNVMENVVPGVLARLDVPDLLAALAPRRVTVIDAADPVGNPLPSAAAETAYAPVRAAYAAAGAAAGFELVRSKPDQPVLELLENWLGTPAATAAAALPPEVEAYYAPVAMASPSGFRTALNRLLAGTHTRPLTYGQVWAGLSATDEDPANPANVILLYGGKSVAKTLRDPSSAGEDAWNREHVWARSHGFPNESARAHNDLHHLRPADKSVNARRGNLDFGEGGRPFFECQCLEEQGPNGHWDPPDDEQGDIARMLFYMAVRYDGDPASRTPDLELSKTPTRPNEPRIGLLCTLLKWHEADPPSDWERLRNGRIETRQGNRNPFIDHPEWVARIWAGECP